MSQWVDNSSQVSWKGASQTTPKLTAPGVRLNFRLKEVVDEKAKASTRVAHSLNHTHASHTHTHTHTRTHTPKQKKRNCVSYFTIITMGQNNL